MRMSGLHIVAIVTAAVVAFVLLMLASFGNPFTAETRHPTILRIVGDAGNENMTEAIQLSEQEIQQLHPEFYQAVTELENSKNEIEESQRITIYLTMEEISEARKFFIQKYVEKLGSDTDSIEEQLDFARGVGFTYNGTHYEYIAEVTTATAVQ